MTDRPSCPQCHGTGVLVFEDTHDTDVIDCPHCQRCEWCNGTGWRGSKPHAWYEAHPDAVTTISPCDCGATPSE